ncbi:GumC family protein, partial [Polymorphobacter multimanifer]|uniref:GumC family protein n=1 Tax=Polymorphobacter multimanifer TaxID=1070431 RepID=UPI001FB16086
MNDHNPDSFSSGDHLRAAPDNPGRRAVRVADSGHVVLYDGLGHDVDRSAYADLWLVVLKWRWVVPAVVVVCVALAAAISFMTTKMYRASATLEIAAEEFKVINTDESATASVSMARNDYLRTQFGLLASRSLAERVVSSLNLASVPGYGFASDDLPDRDMTAASARAAQVLVDGFEVTPVPDSRLVNISFEASDPGMAERVTNAYASSFIASNLERQMRSTVLIRNLLAKRLQVAKERLEASERAVATYARDEGIINLQPSAATGAGSGETSLISSSLLQLNAALSDAQRSRIEAEQKFRQAGETSTEELVNPTIQALLQQRAALTAQYSEMGGLYRDVFPQMEQMRARLA